MTAEVDTDRDVPIIYGRPRHLAPLLIIGVAAALVAASVSYLTYGRVNTATREDVLGNRVVTQRLERLEQLREADNAAHRERNEEAHACILLLLEDLEYRHGARVHLDFAFPDACAQYARPGAVPAFTTTTAVRRSRTTTTVRRRTATTRGTSSRPTTQPATTTTAKHPPKTTTTLIPTVP